MVRGVVGGIYGLCGHRVVGVGCVGRWCGWLFVIGGACRCVAVVGCCVGYEVAMSGGVVGLLMVGSVLFGGELLAVVGVGGICVIGLASGLLVGG